MKTLVLLITLALLVPLTSSACTLVNAKVEWTGTEPCIPQAGLYITIGAFQGKGPCVHTPSQGRSNKAVSDLRLRWPVRGLAP